MRIFADGHTFDDLGQGSKTYLRGLYRAALRLAPSHEFFVAANDAGSVTRELGEAKNLHPLQFRSSNRFSRLAWEVNSLIRNNSVDVAHFQYVSPLRKACAEIVTIHDLLFLDYPAYFPLSYRLSKGFLFKRSARRADHILTVSSYSKDAIVRHFRVPSEKISITPNAVLDFFWEKADGDPPSGRVVPGAYILYVSRFEPRKNQAGLVESFTQLKLWEQGLSLVLVGGKGIPSPDFDRAYASLPGQAKTCVIVLGDVSLTDLRWLYSNCRLFVYPSMAEGFGIPPLEALACGANVLCSNTTAMSDFQFLGDRLFNPSDQQGMTRKIDYYLRNPSFPERDAIREWIKKNYSWDLSASRLLEAVQR